MEIDYEFLLDLDYKFNYSVKNLNLKKKGLQGTLDLSKFTRLVKLDCSSNAITQIINIPEGLLILDCSNNWLKKIKITNFENVRKKLHEYIVNRFQQLKDQNMIGHYNFNSGLLNPFM